MHVLNFTFCCTDENVAANNDRVRVELYDPDVTTWGIDTYCSPTSGPDVEEYNVIVKQGYKLTF
jgi:hypothetical protein